MLDISPKQECPSSAKPLRQLQKRRLTQRTSGPLGLRHAALNNRDSIQRTERLQKKPLQILLKHDNDGCEPPGWLAEMEERYLLLCSEQQRKRWAPSIENSKRKLATTKDIEHSLKKEPLTLKRIIRRFKTAEIVRNFSNKMKRGLTRKVAVSLEEEDSSGVSNRAVQWFRHREGTELPCFISTLVAILGILSIMLLTIIYSLSVVFPEIEQIDMFRAVQLFSSVEFLLNIYFSFTLKRYYEGEALVYLSEISAHYLRGRFLIDLANTLLLLIDLLSSDPVLEFAYARWLILLKLPQVLEKLQTVENLHITSFYRQQYWGLLNVLVINLTFAHILSIALNGMSHLNQNSNWLKDERFVGADWLERYVWGYYWGTTIMLTVGFGDIAATNSMEAGCLIFIEMFSCITLAYNINCVGNLINNLRQQQVEKNNSLKTFQMMVKSNKICRELENKINNYIEESCLIRNRFNFLEQDQLLQGLPTLLRKEYLKDVNKRIFNCLPFLRELTVQSKDNLAQSIIRKITHPDEVVLNRGEPEQCLILAKGALGMMIKRSEQHKNPTCIIQTLSVRDSEKSKLLSKGFIKSTPMMYTLKSMSYSILYYINNEDLITQLQQTNLDYEHFCSQRDKHHISLDSFELYECEHCVGEFHSKFNCPRLHFIPIKQHVVYRYLKRLKSDRQTRQDHERNPDKNMSPFLQRSIILQQIGLLRSSVLDWEEPEADTDPIKSKGPSEQSGDTDPHQFSSVNSESLQEISEQQSKFFSDNKNILDPQILMHLLSEQQHRTTTMSEFWDVQIDCLYNWRYYFPHDNPEGLKTRRIRNRRFQSL